LLSLPQAKEDGSLTLVAAGISTEEADRRFRAESAAGGNMDASDRPSEAPEAWTPRGTTIVPKKELLAKI